MMRNSGYHFPRTSAFPGVQPFQNRHSHNRLEGYQFSLLAPPVPHHAAKTNISCQAKGLKYQVVPGGYDARFQSKMRAQM